MDEAMNVNKYNSDTTIFLSWYGHKINTKALVKLLASFSWVIFLNIGMSCAEFIGVDPPKTTLVSETVFADEKTATTALLGIYSRMTGSFAGFANSSTTVMTGLSADEFANYSSNAGNAEFFRNNLTPQNSSLSTFWNEPYTFIFYANAILEGLASTAEIAPQVKLQLEGEAKFIRAFCHFYLVNLFGDTPYIKTTDYRTNTKISRQPVDEVYELIISDLSNAVELLQDDYPTVGRVRPNRSAALALLARVYLYVGDWEKAEATATNVINNTSVYGLEDNLNNVFLSNSKEAIWQLLPVVPGLNTVEGYNLIFATSPFLVALSDQLMNAFEGGDQRRINWVGSATDGTNTYFYPYKYKVRLSSSVSEHYMVLRLSEQYLIRAEARAKQDRLSEAISDLDVIRQRADVPLVQDTNPLMDREGLLLAIEHERRIEFFAEWGHRWLDLKRTNRAGTVLAPVKGSNWQVTDQLYPLPISQILNDPNMSGNQNPGY